MRLALYDPSTGQFRAATAEDFAGIPPSSTPGSGQSATHRLQLYDTAAGRWRPATPDDIARGPSAGSLPTGLRESLVGFGNSHMAAVPGMLDAFASLAPVVLTANAGIGGNTTAMMKARLASDIPALTKNCLVLEGTNDANAIGGGQLTLAQSLANWIDILTMLRQRGVRPIIILPPPTGSAISYAWAVHQQRLALVLLAESVGLPVYDPYRILVDPATGFYVSGASLDGLHAVNASATAVGLQLWNDIESCRLASLIPTSNEDRGIAGTVKNCLMMTSTGGLADGWTKSVDGVASVESAAADGVAGNWSRLDASAITNQAWIRSDKALGRTSLGAADDMLHLQMALKSDPVSNCTMTVGIEWRSAGGATLIGSTTLIGALQSTAAVVRLQRRLTPPAGTTIARVIVSLQPTSGTYTGTVRVGEFRVISIGQALGKF